jgi:hypothetical protein
MKAGTTSLWLYLKRHPGIFMPEKKEITFFLESEFDRGIDWYASFFEGATEPAIGEASTLYSMYPRRKGVPQRIAETIPETKIIYLVRNPIDRLRSHYLHNAGRGFESAPLADVALNEHHLPASMYWMQLTKYLDHFDRSQIHVVVSEDLFQEPAPTLEGVCRFLGVEIHDAPLIRSNVSADKQFVRPGIASLRATKAGSLLIKNLPTSLKKKVREASFSKTSASGMEEWAQIPPHVRTELEEALRPDVAALRDFLGPTFQGWGLLD